MGEDSDDKFLNSCTSEAVDRKQKPQIEAKKKMKRMERLRDETQPPPTGGFWFLACERFLWDFLRKQGPPVAVVVGPPDVVGSPSGRWVSTFVGSSFGLASPVVMDQRRFVGAKTGFDVPGSVAVTLLIRNDRPKAHEASRINEMSSSVIDHRMTGFGFEGFEF
ncbi:hypothetical protein NL676_032365 [Syzygium grande]|nr:hypothetical protein NL676_032365 [Syzygium grande]